MGNEILGSCSCRHPETLRAADSASHRFSCRHAELDSASAVIKKFVMPEGCCPAFRRYLFRRHPVLDTGSRRYQKSGEIPNQVWNDTWGIVWNDTCFNNGARTYGFTLIELLVVVLIIGILAAVAVPQYQNAVERSRATQGITLLKSIAQAYEAHYMAAGEYARTFDELALDVPWTGNTKFISAATDTKSNGEWSAQIEQSSDGYITLFVARISGKYKGAGFMVPCQAPIVEAAKELRCIERKSAANFLFDTSLPQGAYCEKIVKGVFTAESAYSRNYRLP